VVDFSDFEQRPSDRLVRTLDYVGLLIYRGREAVAAGQRLSARELEHFYREYRGLGRLIEVSERDLPPDWAGFA
jgi:uncharacterized protein (DUF2236 family)